MDEKKSFWTSLPGILTGIAAVMTALATLLGAVYQFKKSSNEDKKPSIVVPSVVNLQLEEAKTAIKEKSLKIGDIDWKEVQTEKPEKVIRQIPQAGKTVPKNTVVDLVVVKAPKKEVAMKKNVIPKKEDVSNKESTVPSRNTKIDEKNHIEEPRDSFIRRGYCTFIATNRQKKKVNDLCSIHDYGNGNYRLIWSDGETTNITTTPSISIDDMPAKIIERGSDHLTVKWHQGRIGFCWNCTP